MRKIRSVLGSNSKVILHNSTNTRTNIPSEQPQRLQRRRKSYTTIKQSLQTTNYKQLLSHPNSTYHFPKSLISAAAAILRNTDGYFYTFIPITLYSPLDFYYPFIQPYFFHCPYPFLSSSFLTQFKSFLFFSHFPCHLFLYNCLLSE